MGKGGNSEVKGFTGMWPLKPGFNLEENTSTLVKAVRRGVALERRMPGRIYWRTARAQKSPLSSESA
jgi:hypothetical protein